MLWRRTREDEKFSLRIVQYTKAQMRKTKAKCVWKVIPHIPSIWNVAAKAAAKTCVTSQSEGGIDTFMDVVAETTS
jgi:hypothetical protein